MVNSLSSFQQIILLACPFSNYPHTLRSFVLQFPLSKALRPPSRTNIHSRQFHASFRSHLAPKKPPPPPKNSASTRKAPNALAYIGGRKPNQTLCESLASKSSPTLLYQAPSHVVYMTTCCLLGGFCVAWSVFNVYGTFISPIGQPTSFVLVAMGITTTLVACGGGFAMFRSWRIINSINALPSSTGSGSRSLNLHLESCAVLPALRPKSVVVAPSDVILSEPIYIDQSAMTAAETASIKQRLATIHELDKTRIMTRPFRHLSYIVWRGYQSLMQVFSQQGFVYLRIKGRNGTWKIDKHAAWALDDGRVLDKLVKHRI